jgi:AraC family transcriptional regulator
MGDLQYRYGCDACDLATITGMSRGFLPRSAAFCHLRRRSGVSSAHCAPISDPMQFPEKPMPADDCFHRMTSLSHREIRLEWPTGRFDLARRSPTDVVEGTMMSDHHMLMITLRGGAERHRFRTDDGLRFDGADTPGAISFLPAGCGRQLELHHVAWTWAALSVPAAAIPSTSALRSFAVAGDAFLWAVFDELDRTARQDDGLDALYCSALCGSALQYVTRRYFGRPAPRRATGGLAPFRLRNLRDYVDAHLAEPICMADLADLCDLSERQFYRAFRASTGITPVQMVQAARIEAAKRLLARDAGPVCAVAQRVGFASASHFARVFQRHAHMPPQAYRRLTEAG